MYAQVHPPTHASGTGSMPELQLWGKRTYWRALARRTAVQVSRLRQDLCRDRWHPTLRPEASRLAGGPRPDVVGLRVSDPGDCGGVWRGRTHRGGLACESGTACETRAGA